MEPNGIGSGMFSSISTGLLGVENPLQQQQPNLQNQQNPHTLHHHPQMVPYAAHHDTENMPQQHQSSRYPFSSKGANNKPQSSTFSDEDEPGFTADEASGDPKRKASPWHRMKWTDAMVRLLIMAVYYIGDEGGSEGGVVTADSIVGGKMKKASSGFLQKKGKWKSVSRAMMEKGVYVSPQQCEDKFNDLNKRYKRVNDILGKGTACRVVENQSLLDTMDHLSPKMKEEVRKLLNSKHLFFREMCAYHNSCGHGGSSNSGAPSNVHQSAEVGTEPSHVQQQQQQSQQHKCSHSTVNGVAMLKGRNVHEEDDGEEEEDDDSEDYSDDEDEDESAEGGSRGQVEDDENDVMRSMRKRPRKCVSNQLIMQQQLNSEVASVLQDGGRSLWEKKQWMKKRVMQLEEQRINYHVQAFELEKQRLKWARFSSKKEREMERDKLENERRRLETERMVLILRQKEIELLNIQHLKKSQQQQQQHSST